LISRRSMGSGSKDGEEAQHHTDTATTSSRRVIPRWLFRADRSLLGRMKTRANPAAELEHAVNDRQSHVEQGAPHSPGFGRPTKHDFLPNLIQFSPNPLRIEPEPLDSRKGHGQAIAERRCLLPSSGNPMEPFIRTR
jgi:hypothetical protein